MNEEKICFEIRLFGNSRTGNSVAQISAEPRSRTG